MYDEKIMNQAIDYAKKTMSDNIGGPFGAAVVKKGEVICVTSNSVLRDNDPTAHAEINAIREACKKLSTYDLSGCELYATGYPCPMCMSAIIWANIKTIYFCNDVKQAEEIGFRDDFIYEFIKKDCQDASIISMTHHGSPYGQKLYDDYANLGKTIY